GNGIILPFLTQQLYKLPKLFHAHSLSQLKIDQSFVRDVTTDNNDKGIAEMIVAMAKSMDLDVIAEGVETESQLACLKKCGCHHFQGYLFGKPVPIEEFEAALMSV
ncbi:EAL domain-containing protein, partial [methanotrophic endosymbiont of Bathymodiolus puteoserpentis (Logatchev)]|uniref:EAL domain-containing protein n=1 Tax=methanotrophic endosymbiont of Bathymodiolus puteoserpentis (Logatchev) TaxID=343235 RepID=UPI00157AE92F